MTGSRFAPVSWSPVLPSTLVPSHDDFPWRHWPVGHWRGFDKGSISVSEGVLGSSASYLRLCFQLVVRDPEFAVTAEVAGSVCRLFYDRLHESQR